MSKQFTEAHENSPQRRIGSATLYSARIQEAMRYNKLRSADYPLVMTIMNAVLQGYTEEEWKAAHQPALTTLTNQIPDTSTTHADTANRYEQTVCNLKDMMLWPW